MLGADDDDQDPEDDTGPDDGMADLAVAADGDSVTADRLRGDERFFPDCRPALQEGQQPHHAVMLTTSDPTFFSSNGGHGSGGYGGVTHDVTASDGGVVLLTENELLMVVDSVVSEVPYSRMQGTIRYGDSIAVDGVGGVAYNYYVANRADASEVAAAYGYLRRKVRESA